MEKSYKMQQIFGKQGSHDGGHFTGTSAMLLPLSNSQNLGKDQALPTLPPVPDGPGCTLLIFHMA